MISRVVEIGGGGDKDLRQIENQIRPHGRRMEARRPGLGGMVICETDINDVEPFWKKTKKRKEAGDEDFCREGTKFVLGRKRKLDVGGRVTQML